MKPTTIPLIIFAVLIAMMLGKLISPEKTATSPLIGKKLPEISLPAAINSAPGLNSNELKGKYAILNIFASWCSSCKIEHNTLIKLKESGVAIYGIAWKDNPEKLSAWLNEKGNPYAAIGADEQGKAIIDLGVTGAPETFVISPDGIILYRYAGPITEDIWKKEISPIIEGRR